MIRRATGEDAAMIAELERLGNASAWSTDEVSATLALPSTRAWVVGDPVCGHVLASSVAGAGEILLVAVHPDQRRAGHASLLLRAVEGCFRAEGVSNATLEVRADNVPARALYHSLGWREAGVRKGYYRDRTDAVLLLWESAC